MPLLLFAALVLLEGHPEKKGPVVARLTLSPGEKVPWHTHEGSERLVLLSGEVRMHLNDEIRVLKAGDYVHILPGIPHAAVAVTTAVAHIQADGPWVRRPFDPAKLQP